MDASNSQQVAQKNWDAFTRAWAAGHKTWALEAEKFNNYYLGDQWDEADKQALEAEGRPALTLNEILQVVNAVLGHYGETRADVSFKPRSGPADQGIANVLTRLTDYIYEVNDYVDYVEPRMFEDGIVEDRGYVDVRMEFDENVLGEVKIRPLDPRTVLPDSDSDSYDPADWKRVITTRWLSLDDIQAHYGKAKRRSVESLATTPSETFGDQSIRYQSFGGEHITWDAGDDKTVKAVRVIEQQYRKMHRVQELVDLETGAARIVPEEWDEERVEQIIQRYEGRIASRHRMRSAIRWTVTCDHVVLHDDWSPYAEFTVVPYFPIYRRGRPSGLVRHLVDPQDNLNKVESQILHTVNTTANSGWMAEAGSLVNMTHEELEQRGAETGLVLVYGRGRTPPQKIQPNPVPAGLDNIANKAQHYVHSIPGASSLLGHNPPNQVSGVALDRMQGKALIGLQVVFNNLEFTRKLIARRVLDCVQTFYSEHRVFRVTNWRDPEQPEEIVEINAELAGEVVNDISMGKYDVVVASSPTRDTFEDMQFAQMVELRKAGVMIPDHHVILASQLAGKQAIAEQVKQLSGLGEPTEGQMRMQQLEMARIEAEVAELQARGQELASRAQHNVARAQTAIASEQREGADLQGKYQMEMARLRADLEKAKANLQNKLEVAQLHSDRRDITTRYQEQIRASEGDRERANRLEQEALRQRGGIAKSREHDQFELLREAMQQRQRDQQPQPPSE